MRLFKHTIICWIYLLIPRIYAGIHENRLLAHLFDSSRSDSHNVLERPIFNESQPVGVRFGSALLQILDVDEKNQIIKMSIMIVIQWKDYHFHWEPSDYGGITSINVPPDVVWKPDVLLYNSADENFNAANPVQITITNDGRMSYQPPGLFKSTCPIDVRWFPFDIQSCELKFGTWSYNGLDVDLKIQCPDDDFMLNNGDCTKNGNVSMASYIESGEWKILGNQLKRNSKKYNCCPETYIDVKMIMIIQRKALYYIFNFVLPCLIITMVALLDFLLPSDAGEKISLGVTIMLSLSMFQLILADRMPQSSESTPLLAVYFSSMMTMSSLSILFTVLVLSCHHNEQEIPVFLKVFVNQWLAKLLFIEKIDTKSDNSSTASTSELIDTKPSSSSKFRMPVVSPTVPTISSLSNNNVFSSSPPGYKVVSSDNFTPFYKQNLNQKQPVTSSSLLANVLDLPTDTHGYYQDNYRKMTKQAGGYDRRDPLLASTTPRTADKPLRQPREQHDNYHDERQYNTEHEDDSDGNECGGHMTCSLEQDLQTIRWHIEFVTLKIKESDQESDLLKEWKFAAYVIDRFCLIFFSFCAFCVTITFFILGA